MSNTSLPNSLITTLNIIQLDMGRYLYPIIIILGNIGSIFNILILTQRLYLQNSCSCYILASSVVNLLIINIAVLFRALALGFSFDPTTTSWFFCKFRIYVAHVTTLLSRFYIVLACIDRWAMSSTSVRRRAFSQVKVAKVLISSVGIGWCIISIHIPLYYSIIGGRCMQTLTVYVTFYNIYNTVLSGFSIPVLMIIFGVLAIRNIKHSRQRVNARVNLDRMIVNQAPGKTYTKSREYQISIMILVQIGVYLITCLPFPVYLVYSTITMYWKKTSVQIALDNFSSTIAYTLVYINFSVTFYIYVLTTRVFRKALKQVILKNRLLKLCYGIQQEPAITRAVNGAVRVAAVEINQRTIPNI